MVIPNQNEGCPSSAEKHTHDAKPAAKWLSSVNDINVHSLDRHVKAHVLKDQAGAPANHVLMRDHGSDHDVPLTDDTLVDLAEGNVFFTVSACDHHPKGNVNAPAKRAWFVNDRPAITLRTEQTGHTVRDLFGMEDSTPLFRDYESPNDELIGVNMVVRFADGPVFYTRCDEGLSPQGPIKIVVNGREKMVTEKELTYAQVVRLAFDLADPETIYTVTYKKGPPSSPQGSMVEGDTVKLYCGMILNVTATRKS